MTNETALTLSDTISLGGVLAKSGYFSDAKGEAQAVVKVLAGREMGFGPIASMTGVHIVQGKPSIGANLLGAAIKSSGKYDYRVVELTNDRAEIAFYQHGEEVGRSEFTMSDAQVAGLTGNPTWKKFPRNMLFSRAMSNGARWYCPDVFSGVTPYTPEELGADVDEEGDVIDVTPTVAKPVPAAKSDNGGNAPADAPDDPSQITSPKQLYDTIQELGYYHSIPHMLNTMRKLTGDEKLSWPAGDGAWYADALGQLTEYARANQAQDAVKELADQKAMPF